MESIITNEKASLYFEGYLNLRPRNVLDHLHKVHTAGYFVDRFEQRSINPARYGFIDLTIPHPAETILDISQSRSVQEFDILEPRLRQYVLTMVKAILTKLEGVDIDDETRLRQASQELFDVLYSTLFNFNKSELIQLDMSGIPELRIIKERLLSIIDSDLQNNYQSLILENFRSQIVLERESPIGYLVDSEERRNDILKTYFHYSSEFYLPDLVVPNLKRLRSTVQTM
jgi:hypothetical protein